MYQIQNSRENLFPVFDNPLLHHFFRFMAMTRAHSWCRSMNYCYMLLHMHWLVSPPMPARITSQCYPLPTSTLSTLSSHWSPVFTNFHSLRLKNSYHSSCFSVETCYRAKYLRIITTQNKIETKPAKRWSSYIVYTKNFFSVGSIKFEVH